MKTQLKHSYRTRHLKKDQKIEEKNDLTKKSDEKRRELQKPSSGCSVTRSHWIGPILREKMMFSSFQSLLLKEKRSDRKIRLMDIHYSIQGQITFVGKAWMPCTRLIPSFGAVSWSFGSCICADGWHHQLAQAQLPHFLFSCQSNNSKPPWNKGKHADVNSL